MNAEAMPLLLTKLEVPPLHAQTLARERLLARLRVPASTRLVLVSAPAGFGKTTLLASWSHVQAEHGVRVAWLSLEERDNDPARFLAYLDAAVAHALAPGQGAQADPASESAGPRDAEQTLTRLANALARLQRPTLLVLDDYHVIAAPAIHAAVAFLLEHLPEQACLAIGTRADPILPLTRLRVRDQLVELRAADLSFTLEEIRDFFQRAYQLDLTPAEAAAILQRLEGWPAGVQLAALAFQADPGAQEAGDGDRQAGGVADRLDGSQRALFSYLAEEVFERQPAHRKSFLLQTAILDRMCAPLCDALLGADGGEACSSPEDGDSYSRMVLEELEHANLFITPLDRRHCWYRYHHLFRAFLCARLEREPPHIIAELHLRVGTWFEQHQLYAEALDHTLARGEFAQAADLIERIAAQAIERGEYASLHRWLEHIPEDLLQNRPVLCLWAAWAALLAGEVERIEPLLQPGARAWQRREDQSKLGELAHLRAHLARLRHDPAGTFGAARQALEYLGAEQATLRAGSLLALGAGQLLDGQVDAAQLTLTTALAECQAHNFLGMLVARVWLGDVAALRGQLGAARAAYELAIQQAGAHPVWERWVAAIRLADLAREGGELERAQQQLQTTLATAEQQGVAVYLPAGYIALARTLAARAEFGAADDALDQGLRMAQRLGSPAYQRQVEAWRARLALARGDLAAAQCWQASLALNLEGEIGYERVLEALAVTRVLIACTRSGDAPERLAAARKLLGRLREQALADGRKGCLIEILTLAALAEHAGGRLDMALRHIRQALTLAGAEGYTRIFVDEGAPLADLLRAAYRAYRSQPATPPQLIATLQRLLASCSAAAACELAVPAGALHARLAEPLSSRELEVLGLIARGESNQVIANAMVISLGTVKSHINHILGKLAAANRTEAVARARGLGLLAP
jgi:LuxR family maltose regulon positive regulatory protein